MTRTGAGQTLTIDPRRLRFPCQGMDPAAGGAYGRLPWRPALLTRTNPTC
ncbi:Extracellular exo-alpha-L-arabinofuranosidase precursor [Streptomyces sp. Go-475]|nr:Extracellular exo-alpha-L-arabinofuranosidase precursor [Streptomyces sp. Go-475]